MPKRAKIPAPYKSKYEYEQATRLEEHSINFEYEAHTIDYHDTVQNGTCMDCGSTRIGVGRRYTPDFWFPNSNLYVETKGKFDRDNRRKMIAICEECDVEIRMVFMRDNWLTRKHGMKYSTWCDRYGITYAIGDIPLEWVNDDKIK
jgi:hypothetical protein